MFSHLGSRKVYLPLEGCQGFVLPVTMHQARQVYPLQCVFSIFNSPVLTNAPGGDAAEPT